jgi:hypothetical protein
MKKTFVLSNVERKLLPLQNMERDKLRSEGKIQVKVIRSMFFVVKGELFLVLCCSNSFLVFTTT